MKVMSITAILLAGLMANAQTSSTTDIVTEGATIPAAGTSTSTIDTKAEAQSPFSFSIVDEMETTRDAAEAAGGISKSEISHAIGATLKYKINDSLNVGFRQYFESTTHNPEKDPFYTSHSALLVGTKFSGFAGSEDIAPAFSYYLPTSSGIDSFERILGADISDYYGILRMDAEIKWVVNPLVSLSYYANPRQTIAGQQTLENGKTFESVTRYYHLAILNVTPNDTINPYMYLGHDLRANTQDLRAQKEDLLLGIGTNIALGKFSLIPEIYSSNNIRNAGEVQVPRYLDHETINYYLAASVAF